MPGIEVRLFNPFLSGRDSHFGRLLDSALGDERLHRRMHNKLLVADGVLAPGGRAQHRRCLLPADRAGLLRRHRRAGGRRRWCAQMSQAFDLYWNSDYSHERAQRRRRTPLGARSGVRALAQTLRQRLRHGRHARRWRRPGRADPALTQAFDQGRLPMRLALASVAYDSPAKIENEQVAVDIGMLATSGAQVRLLVAQAIQRSAQRAGDRLALPDSRAGRRGWRWRELREARRAVTLLTNSLAATDEPAGAPGLPQVPRGAAARGRRRSTNGARRAAAACCASLLAGGTVLRLHAKAALIDRERVFLGSMNFDPRSRDLNTEFGLLIHSPELAEELHALLIAVLMREGAYRLHLDADGRTLHWTAGDSDLHVEAFEPDTDFGSRLLLDLLEPFVPEEML